MMGSNRSHRLAPAVLLLAMVLGACRSPDAAPTPTPPEARDGTVTVNGADLYYRVMGQGEPVLVIHGGPGLDHSYLLPQMAPLAEEVQLIFYDQRATGRSSADVDTGTVSLDQFVEDIEAVRRAAGAERVHLLGHSWGGLLAMNYAIRYPERLRSLILSNSMGASSDLRGVEDSLLQARATPDDEADLQRIRSSEAFAEGRAEAYEDLFRVFFRKEFHDRSRAAELTLTFPDDFRARNATLQALGRDLVRYDFHPDLSSVSVSTLILYGDDEPLADLAGPRLQRSIPNATLVRIPASGHFPYIEQPEAFFDTVMRHIRGN